MKIRSQISRYLFLLIFFAAVTGSCKKDEESPPVSDIEGNVYKTVIIGSQVWMAENLKTAKYNNDTQIPLITGNTEWTAAKTAGYCWYGNNEATYKNVYGAFYNWYAVNTGRLCPTGWHVPTDTEFNTMELFLGVPENDINLWDWRGTDQGSQLKSSTKWDGSNKSGFSALPGGYRSANSGEFYALGILAYWWTSTESISTEAWYRRLDTDSVKVYKAATNKKAGKFVRCIKNSN
jgi:uncharacterized protein (TIGR02145 family)